MFKYLVWVLKVFFPLMWAYFSWMLPYSRKPDKYPLELRRQKGQKLAKKFLKILKIDIEIRNMPEFKEGEVYYIVGNHTSILDIVVMLAIMPIPISFVSKAENKKVPFIGRMMKVYKGLYIERNNLRQEMTVMQKTRESLRNKETSWLIFPEGTRNKEYNGALLGYKAGSFKAPLASGTTIAPVVMWGNQMVLPLRTRAKRYKTYVEFLPLYEPEGTTLAIASNIEAQSNAAISRLREEYNNTQKLNKYGRKIINTPPSAEPK